MEYLNRHRLFNESIIKRALLTFLVCRNAIFKEPLKAQDKMLSNHSLGEHLVMTEDQCHIQCYLNNDCVSYNLGPSSIPGSLLCELNNADRYQYPQDYRDEPEYSYRGAMVLLREHTFFFNSMALPFFTLTSYLVQAFVHYFLLSFVQFLFSSHGQ